MRIVKLIAPVLFLLYSSLSYSYRLYYQYPGAFYLDLEPSGPGACPLIISHYDYDYYYASEIYHKNWNQVGRLVCYYARSTTSESGCLEGEKKLSINNDEFHCTPSPLAVSSNNGQGSSCNASSPSNNTSRPINISTGNKFFTNNYFTGQGINPLRLSFFYNSNSSETVWTSTYRQSLDVNADEIEAKRADGQILFFSISEDVITGQSQRSERLVLNGDIYELTLQQ
jgi:hypothetical protein